MAEILRKGQVHQDSWQVLRPEADADLAGVCVPAGQWLVPFALWQTQYDALKTRGDIGVWLSPTDDLSEVAQQFTAWPLVAIDFPKFTDGRGYSIAWRLRNHYQYSGELRAMLRVGFDTLALDPKVAATTAERNLAPFPDTYQGSTDNPAPLFRRTERAASAS